MDKIKLAIIGCGGMGTYHFNRMTCSGIFEIVGIYDVDPAVKEKITNGSALWSKTKKILKNNAKEGKNITFFASFDELAAYSGLQAVLIATPNDFHRDYTVRCAEKGIAVLCEKPVTLSCEDLKVMIDAAKAHNTVFSVHQNRRWDNDYMVMKKIVEEGKIGHVYKLESKVLGSHGIPGAWRKIKKQGGGMIFDWGVHLIDQLCWFDKSPITSVFCKTSYVYGEEVDDGFELNMEFSSGLNAVVTIDTNSFVKLPRWMIYGMNGTAVIPDFNPHARGGKIVRVKQRVDKRLKGVQAGNGFTKTMADRSKSTVKKERLPKIKDDGLDLYRNFAHCVAERKPEDSVIKPAELLRVLGVIEAAFLSAEKNEVIHTNLSL